MLKMKTETRKDLIATALMELIPELLSLGAAIGLGISISLTSAGVGIAVA
jgi:hypothetical protein